jgi:formyl-CoA transferase
VGGGGPLTSPRDVSPDPQLGENGYVVDIEHPLFGTYKTFGPPLQMDATPTRIRSAAPQLDEHTEEVLGELGFGESEREQMRAAGVTGAGRATSA